MVYRIEGLAPDLFRDLPSLSDAELAARRAVRIKAESASGFPCRISLEESAKGEPLFLVNFLSHDTESPFLTRYAIYVRESARKAAVFVDEVPGIIERRTVSMRGFDEAGMLREARIAAPGESDGVIRAMLERPEITSIHAHNAAYGCFLARVERA